MQRHCVRCTAVPVPGSALLYNVREPEPGTPSITLLRLPSKTLNLLIERHLYETVIHQRQTRLTLMNRMRVLRRRPPGVPRHGDAPGPCDRVTGFVVAIAVGRENRDPVAGCRAARDQPDGQPCDPISTLGDVLRRAPKIVAALDGWRSGARIRASVNRIALSLGRACLWRQRLRVSSGRIELSHRDADKRGLISISLNREYRVAVFGYPLEVRCVEPRNGNSNTMTFAHDR